MPDSLTFNYVRKTDDYWREVGACVAAELSHWYVLASGALVLALLSYVVVGTVNGWIDVTVLVLVGVIFAIKIPIYGYLGYRYWNALKQAAPPGGEEIAGVADANGIEFSGFPDGIEYSWTDILTVVEKQHYFLLRARSEPHPSGRYCYSYIPKRAFGKSLALNAFRDLLRAHAPGFRAWTKV